MRRRRRTRCSRCQSKKTRRFVAADIASRMAVYLTYILCDTCDHITITNLDQQEHS